LRLDRDLNLLLVDARRPWGNGRLLPAGSLREPRVQAARATAFIVTRADIHPGALIEELERDFPSRPVFTARHRPVRLKSIFGEGQKGFEYLEGRKALAFCGLARPGDFLDTLRDLKVEVVESVAWPDHYQPGREDVDNLLKKAEALGAEVILCTAKDAVKLKQMDPPGQHSSEIWSLEIEFEILDRPDEFERLLYPGGRSGRA